MSVRNMLKVVMSVLLATAIAATADTRAARVDQSPASVAGTLNDKIPYLLCIRICIGRCVCDKRPIEYAECICRRSGDSSNSNKPTALLHTSEAALQVNGKSENSGPIPYAECIETCSKCACTLVWPREKSICLCLDDESVPKNAAAVADRLDQQLASVTEKANELYEKLDLLVGPVPKRTGGYDKRMVLWTTSKMEAQFPYRECIKTCKACACTLIWPPEASTCFCMSPKPQVTSGKDVAK